MESAMLTVLLVTPDDESPVKRTEAAKARIEENCPDRGRDEQTGPRSNVIADSSQGHANFRAQRNSEYQSACVRNEVTHRKRGEACEYLSENDVKPLNAKELRASQAIRAAP
jgi:hypothetical protein